MLRTALLLGVLALAAIACNGDDDSPAATSPANVSPTGGTNASPTDAASESPTATSLFTPTASPSDDCLFVSLGLCASVAEVPPLPEGLIRVTNFVTLQADKPSEGATIGLSVNTVAQGEGLAWWTYVDGEWHKLDTEATPQQADPPGEGAIIVGNFNPVPENIIALSEN